MNLVRRSSIALLAWMLAIALIPAGSLYANPADDTGNLVQNGGFDEQLAHWVEWPEEGETFEVADAPDRPDNPSLMIQTDDIPVQWGIVEVSQHFDVYAHQPFTLSADVGFVSSEASIVTVRIDYIGEHGGYTGHFFEDVEHPEGAFKTVDLSGIVPEGTKLARIALQIKATEPNAKGLAYFDNIRFEHVWAPTRLHAEGATETSISLAWDAPLQAGSYLYEIYGDGDQLIASTEDTAYTVEGLPADVSVHRFYVVASRLDDPADRSIPSNLLRAATKKPAGTVTIMPFGDSITVGEYSHNTYVPGGYRGYLQQLLADKHPQTMFVGSQRTNADGTIDPDHEGHEGYHTYDLAPLIEQQIRVYSPDIVLLHAGTNDMWLPEHTADRQIEEMLIEIGSLTPDTYVIVASIPGIYEEDPLLLPRIDAYNARLKEIVSTRRALGQKVGYVDMAAMVTEPYFTAEGGDKIHPNAEGYQVMADVWYDAIDAVINTGDVAGMVPAAPVLQDPVPSEDSRSAELRWSGAADNIGIVRYEIVQDGAVIQTTSDTSAIVTGLLGSSTYTYAVEAVDKAGNRSRSNTVMLTTPTLSDDLPPTKPAELAANGITHDALTLSWLPGTDESGIGGYDIIVNGTTTSVTDAVSGEDGRLTYVITDLTPETSYTIELKTFDTAGNRSESSEPYTVETASAPPSGLRVTTMTPTAISLAWDPASDRDGVNGYRIYVNDALTGETAETSYTLDGLVQDQTYRIYVTAVDQLNNETAPSVIVSQQTVLRAPSGLAKLDVTYDTVKVRWTAVSGASGYRVFVNDAEYATVTDTELQIKQLQPSTTYRIAVQTLFGEDSSALSEALNVQTVNRPSSSTVITFIPQPEQPKDDLDYADTEDGILLRFTPNAKELNEALKDGEQPTITVPSDEPFDALELALSGETLKLASDGQAAIIVRMGELTLNLNPGWLPVTEQDVITLKIEPQTLTRDASLARQSLQPLSPAYSFEVLVNDSPAAAFASPITLSVAVKSKLNADVTGIYVQDGTTGDWRYAGGTIGEDGTVTLDLHHFSAYAVMTSTKTFADIRSHWARASIEALAAKEVLKGKTEFRFDPDGEVTRAEFAAMLARAFRLESSAGQLPFADVKDGAWYYDGVLAAYQAGIIEGLDADRFGPDAFITREQMVVMIMRTHAYLASGDSPETDSSASASLSYKDAADISSWALAAVGQADALELIEGMDGSFMPALDVNRAQAAVMIHRLLNMDIR